MRRSEDGTGKVISAAALDLLDRLPEDLRGKAQGSFADATERRRWTYLPGERAGVSFGELDRGGRKAVHRLVAAGLQPHAYAQVAAIMALEDVLDHSEGARRGRHNTDYWVLIFGDPGGSDPWGWRFEGHHTSLNMTIEDERVLSATPCFLGANPATVGYGSGVVLRPLAQEEELARSVLEELGPKELERAVVAPKAPSDIRTKSRPEIEAQAEPVGVRGGDLSGDSAEALKRLVGYYLDRVAADVARKGAQALEGDGFKRLDFAWEGPLERGRPHYYRVQGPGLLIEYDNTQNNANHIHSVWRDPEGDFGGDVLARHYANHHPG